MFATIAHILWDCYECPNGLQFGMIL